MHAVHSLVYLFILTMIAVPCDRGVRPYICDTSPKLVLYSRLRWKRLIRFLEE
jgi:hypothetical protein